MSSPGLDIGGADSIGSRAASTGSRATSVVLPAVPSFGKVAMVSGVIFSTGAALLLFPVEAVSPVEDVTFFPQLANGATMMEQSKAVETMRGINDSGIVHLSLR